MSESEGGKNQNGKKNTRTVASYRYNERSMNSENALYKSLSSMTIGVSAPKTNSDECYDI